MLDIAKKLVFFGVALVVLLCVMVGWSFIAFGPLAFPLDWLVNFIGWLVIGIAGQESIVWLAKRWNLW